MQEKSEYLIILDADDTLWHCNKYYFQAYKEAYSIISEAPGVVDLPEYEDYLKDIQEFDISRIKLFGYNLTRFIENFILYYSHYLAWPSDYDPRVEKKLKSLEGILWQTPEVFSETHPILGVLKSQFNMTLAVHTLGAPNLQWHKLRSTGTQLYFDYVSIVGKKTATELRDIAKEMGYLADRCIVIGNSPRSDINPALEAGMTPILVKPSEETWVHDDVITHNNQYDEVCTLEDAFLRLSNQGLLV